MAITVVRSIADLRAASARLLADSATLQDAAQFASVAAALATTRKGAQASYPDAAEVNAALA